MTLGRALFLVALLTLAASPALASDLININTADAALLETLPGIGPSKSAAIIDYRTQNGPFARIEDIQNVSGIGPSTYANIAPLITVGASSTAAPSASSTPSSGTASVDLSGWRLSADGRTFRIPEGTLLLPKSEVLFPRTITNFPITFEAALLYPSGGMAASYPPPSPPQVVQPPAPEESSYVVQKVVPESLSSVSGPAHEIQAVSAPAVAKQPAAAGAAFVEEAPLPEEESPSKFSELLHSPWTFGFLGLMALSAGAFILL